jgi:hypothetical protein
MYQSLKQQMSEYKDVGGTTYTVTSVQSATLGGNLGKCLADINKYHSATEFLKDLSKATAISSCFMIALAELPILKYFAIAGGVTYAFYTTMTN